MSPHAQSSAHPAQRDAQRARGKSRPLNTRLTATPPRESYAESSGTAARQPAENRSGPVNSDVAITGADEESNGSSQLGDACWICAEPFKHYSVSKCDHRTCHVCALRLRELYKRLDCTFCKTAQQTVIFTASPDAPFSSFAPESIQYKDTKRGIWFETQEMMEETHALLRHNCPDPDCEYVAPGWGDLKLHVRGIHEKRLCELCLRSKKVFVHEQILYTAGQLPFHLPSMNQRSRSSAASKEQIEGGVHPLCQFCRECSFDSDELFRHMRDRHEECFICKRNGVRDKYFQDWATLENHFKVDHHPCPFAQCLEKKFVVFNTALDLKAHMVEEHGGEMSSRDKKDARRVPAEFEFERASVGAGPSGGRRNRNAFGAALTSAETADVQFARARTPEANRRPSPSPPSPDQDPIVAGRLAVLLARVRVIAPNPATAIPAVKAAIRSYRTSESSARDLISTIWNTVDQKLDETAGVVNSLVDLMEEEDKKRDVLSSWNGFRIEQLNQFPELVPMAVGPGYAGVAGGRVINAKKSISTRSNHQTSRRVWERVAQAAASSSTINTSSTPRMAAPRFPPLPTPAPPSFRQPQRQTPWVGSAGSSFRPSTAPAQVRSEAANNAVQVPAPPRLTNASFPQLPTTAPRNKPPTSGNQSLKRIVGEPRPLGSAWVGNGVGASGGDGTEVNAAREIESGRSKKGKGKQKQTLFTLGST